MKLRILFLSLALASAAEAQSVATLKSFKGDVTFKAASGGGFVKPKMGQPVVVGDSLATDVDSEAVLGFPQGADVKVFELSQVRVNEMFLSPDRNKLQLFLRTGRVETSTPPQPLARTDFSVSTPVATASIRGSHQLVSHADGFGTHVEFLKGFGFTSTPAGQRVLQAAGQRSQISSRGGLSGPSLSARRASKPALMSSGHDDTEQAAAADAGGLSDRTANDPSSPTRLGNSVNSSSGPARLRVTIQRIP